MNENFSSFAMIVFGLGGFLSLRHISACFIVMRFFLEQAFFLVRFLNDVFSGWLLVYEALRPVGFLPSGKNLGVFFRVGFIG